MPSGGARARSGPAPDPNALRRDRKDDAATWVTLPVGGRKGRAPKCPLLDPLKREADLWRELWKLPQAVMWERLHLEREVALYVRAYIVAEGGTLIMGKDGEPVTRDVTASDRALVVRLADSLGLNTAGMARNRWRIGVVESADVPSSGGGSIRDHLKVVNGGGA